MSAVTSYIIIIIKELKKYEKKRSKEIKNKIIGSFVTPEYPNHIIREMLKFSLKQKT